MIRALISSTPGTNDLPTDLEFHTTADGGNAAVRRFYITNAGVLTQDATNGGNIVLSAASTGYLWGSTSFAGDAGSNTGAPLLIVENPVNRNHATIIANNANTSGVNVAFMKTRSTGSDADTIVASGDTIGQINFQGGDGASYRTAAQIISKVDGTPGSSDMP